MTDLLGLLVMLARDADGDRTKRPSFGRMWRDTKRSIASVVSLIDEYVDSWVDDQPLTTTKKQPN